MAAVLQPILDYGKSMGWKGRTLSIVGFMLATDVIYAAYLRIRNEIRKRKSQKPFCVVRFMNRIPFNSDCPLNTLGTRFANIAYLISYIDRAQHSISLSIYILTLQDVCDAIIRARKERNVVVRIICCESMVYNEGSKMRFLVEDCFVRFKVKSSYLMHHKFCLLDVDWLCAKCLVKEHLQQVGNTPKDMQFTLFDKAILDDMAGLEKAFGTSCPRCDYTKRKQRSNAISNPLPEGGCLVTGSSNWTVPALTLHWDNMIFTTIPEILRPFAVEFQRQWYELSDMEGNL